MADTAFGAVGLVVDILRVIQEIQRAHESMRGTSKALKSISYELDSTSKSLILIKDEPNLQTPSVEQQLVAIVHVGEELLAFSYQLQNLQRKRGMRRFAHALNSGDKDDAHLSDILSRLDRARNELILRISVAQVGLMGNLNEGFRVNAKILMDTNKKCKMILGRELALANQMKGKRVQPDGKVPLCRQDVQKLRLTDPANMKNLPRQSNVLVQRNITFGKSRIAVGDVGCSGWERPGRKNTAIESNQLGNNLHMMVGDVQGKAAPGFFDSKFWD